MREGFPGSSVRSCRCIEVSGVAAAPRQGCKVFVVVGRHGQLAPLTGCGFFGSTCYTPGTPDGVRGGCYNRLKMSLATNVKHHRGKPVASIQAFHTVSWPRGASRWQLPECSEAPRGQARGVDPSFDTLS